MRAPSTSATVTAMTTGVSDISALRNSSSSNSPSLPGEALLQVLGHRDVGHQSNARLRHAWQAEGANMAVL